MILEKLKHQRKVVKKVTQVEMAEVLEMSRETYSRKERGVYDFTLKEFEKAITCNPNSIFAKQAREELKKITPALTPSLTRHPKSRESYASEKTRKRRRDSLSSFPWETLALFAFLAFVIAWVAARLFFSDEIQKYFNYFAGQHPLLFYAIGTFILGILLFPAFNRMETEERTSAAGFFQRLHWAGLGLGGIIFICFLLLFIYHLIVFIISIVKYGLISLSSGQL